MGFTKNAGATWWIPGEDEWYKAAYYKGEGQNSGYWDYPTQSDIAPGNNIGGAANQANWSYNGNFAVTQSPAYHSNKNYLTDGGACSNSASAYGTFDQGGNVQEWNDAVIYEYEPVFGDSRGVRGGMWESTGAEELRSSSRLAFEPTFEDEATGFRVASGFVSIGSDSLSVGITSSDQSANFSSGTSDFYNIYIGGDAGFTNNSVSVANGGTVVEAFNNIIS